MSAEDFEIFKIIREQQRARKAQRADRADEIFEEVRAELRELGLDLSRPSERHWQVRDEEGRVVMNYWPSTMRLQYGSEEKAKKNVRMKDFRLRAGRMAQQ